MSMNAYISIKIDDNSSLIINNEYYEDKLLVSWTNYEGLSLSLIINPALADDFKKIYEALEKIGAKNEVL